MTQEHPITPPPELIEDWIEMAKPLPQRPPNPGELATLAARWGADQELEACCEWMASETPEPYINALRDARRPKPPSLKEQALVLIETVEISQDACSSWDFSVVRLALESLPD